MNATYGREKRTGRAGFEPARTDLLRKGYLAQKTKVDDAERSRVVRISTGAMDRDNEVLRPDGAEFEQYLANPVVLFAHDYQSVPVGKCAGLKVDSKGIVAKTVYNKTALAEEIFQLARDGFPLAVSVGFLPLEMVSRGAPGFQEQLDECVSKGWVKETEAEKVRRIFTKWTLLEYSDVPVPANPEALQLMVSKGWKKPVGAMSSLPQLGGGGNLFAQTENIKKGGTMPVEKGGGELSAANAEHLAKAIEHGEECIKRMKAVLASHNGGEPDGDEGCDDGDEPLDLARPEKLLLLGKQLSVVLDGMVSQHVNAAGDELLAMVARATGRHIEL